MCAPVAFIYRCGCIMNVVFECPDTYSRLGHEFHATINTHLNEDCHNCCLAAKDFEIFVSSSQESRCEVNEQNANNEAEGRRVLREISLNVPTKMPPRTQSEEQTEA